MTAGAPDTRQRRPQGMRPQLLHRQGTTTLIQAESVTEAWTR